MSGQTCSPFGMSMAPGIRSCKAENLPLPYGRGSDYCRWHGMAQGMFNPEIP